MKKMTCCVLLLSMAFLVWCSSWNKEEKIDITETKFDVEVCDNYFALLDCIIDNDWNKKYSFQAKNDLRSEILAFKDEWYKLDNESLTKKCSENLDEYIKIEDKLIEIGCDKWLKK